MFFDELVAADKRISNLRMSPKRRRGAMLDAYRHDRDSTAPYAVDVDYAHSVDNNNRRFSRGKVFFEA